MIIHITTSIYRIVYLTKLQCEKFSKKEEALEKLRNGAKFDEVAREFSEDKARQGMYCSIFLLFYMLFIHFPLGVAICWVMLMLRKTVQAAPLAGRPGVVWMRRLRRRRMIWSRVRRETPSTWM